MKIKQKIILGYLVIAFVIGIMGYLIVNISHKEVENLIGRSSILLAENTLNKVDRNIHGRIEQLRAYSKDLANEEGLLRSNYEFEKMDNIQDYIDERDKASRGEETAPFMQDLIENELSTELREELELKVFYEEEYGYPIYSEVFVTNRFGVNVAQTDSTSDYRQDDEDWWQTARKEGLYVSDVEYDESADVYSINISTRIESVDGEFLGVMKAVLNIRGIIDIIQELEPGNSKDNETFSNRLYKTTHLNLITSSGKIIYSTKHVFDIWKDVSRELLLRINEKEKVNYFTEFHEKDGNEEFIVYAHSSGYKSFKGLGWILFVEHNIEEILIPIVRMKKNITGIALSVVIFAVLIGVFIARSISRPLIKLKNAANEIGKGRLDAEIDIELKDEIGELAESFKSMAGNLKHSTTSIERLNHEIVERKQVEADREELNSRLVSISRQAGMAEVATGVLHNVGNVLNSVNVSAALLSDKFHKSRIKDLKRAMEIIEEHKDDMGTFVTEHPQGRHLAKYLIELSKYLVNEQGEMDEEVQSIIKNIEHIKEIVNMQQSYSGISGVTEKVSVKELLEDAVRMSSGSFEKYQIKIVREYEDVPDIITDKHKLIQIFTNLVSNAKHALMESAKPDKRMILRIEKNGAHLSIDVMDDGVGISNEDLTRIFLHGFTTKKKGHGFGLHSSALAAKDLGGELSVTSGGKGHGACFTLDVPVDVFENMEVA